MPVELPHHRCYFVRVFVTGINCKVSGGGGPCDTDRDCGHFGPTEQGGKCLAGKCVCNKGYTCGKCQARGQYCHKKACVRGVQTQTWGRAERVDCPGMRIAHAPNSSTMRCGWRV